MIEFESVIHAAKKEYRATPELNRNMTRETWLNYVMRYYEGGCTGYHLHRDQTLASLVFPNPGEDDGQKSKHEGRQGVDPRV